MHGEKVLLSAREGKKPPGEGAKKKKGGGPDSNGTGWKLGRSEKLGGRKIENKKPRMKSGQEAYELKKKKGKGGVT